ncbi:MAG: VOC family protein, partial [Acidimicrobiales bacterium]
RDPGVGEFGLHNALFPIGDTFLEIVSPTAAGTTAGRLLERRGGDGGYMVLVQTDDLDDARRRIEASGARIVYTAKGEAITGLHLHPRDLGGAIVSIDQATPAEDWEWAGPQWRRHVRTDTVTEIDAVEIQAADPAAMAARWAEVLGGSLDEAGTTLAFDRGAVRFVPIADDRGEGVAGVVVRAADPARRGHVASACGTRFTFA